MTKLHKKIIKDKDYETKRVCPNCGVANLMSNKKYKNYWCDNCGYGIE